MIISICGFFNNKKGQEPNSDKIIKYYCKILPLTMDGPIIFLLIIIFIMALNDGMEQLKKKQHTNYKVIHEVFELD